MTGFVMNIIMGVMLLLCSVQDLYKKRVRLSIILIGSILIGLGIPFCSSISIWDRAGGVIIGISLILVSLATRGKIGMGDGLLLCSTGLGLGFWNNLELLSIALFLAAVVSVLLLVFHTANRKKSIPFVPFIFTGYLFLLIMSGKT